MKIVTIYKEMVIPSGSFEYSVVATIRYSPNDPHFIPDLDYEIIEIIDKEINLASPLENFKKPMREKIEKDIESYFDEHTIDELIEL